MCRTRFLVSIYRRSLTHELTLQEVNSALSLPDLLASSPIQDDIDGDTSYFEGEYSSDTDDEVEDANGADDIIIIIIKEFES